MTVPLGSMTMRLAGSSLGDNTLSSWRGLLHSACRLWLLQWQVSGKQVSLWCQLDSTRASWHLDEDPPLWLHTQPPTYDRASLR